MEPGALAETGLSRELAFGSMGGKEQAVRTVPVKATGKPEWASPEAIASQPQGRGMSPHSGDRLASIMSVARSRPSVGAPARGSPWRAKSGWAGKNVRRSADAQSGRERLQQAQAIQGRRATTRKVSRQPHGRRQTRLRTQRDQIKRACCLVRLVADNFRFKPIH